jgi:twitching motility protein PilT
MHTMDRHLADLANSGIITQRAAMDKAQDVEGLKQLIHRVETPSDAASRAMDESSINFNDAYSGAGN